MEQILLEETMVQPSMLLQLYQIYLQMFKTLDFSFFYDAANVWGVDYDSSIDENSTIRSSTGVAFDLVLRLLVLLSLSAYSIPITKSSSDACSKHVRFNMGTIFW